MLQKLLLEEAGLTYQDLVKKSRWGAYAPRVASSMPVTALKKGSMARDAADRRIGEASQSTRHAFHPRFYVVILCHPVCLQQRQRGSAALLSRHWQRGAATGVHGSVAKLSWIQPESAYLPLRMRK